MVDQKSQLSIIIVQVVLNTILHYLIRSILLVGLANNGMLWNSHYKVRHYRKSYLHIENIKINYAEIRIKKSI